MWTVDPTTATNAPNILTVNITTNMLLPDVESIWVEGDVDNSNALVKALVSSDSGDMTTNSLNVWKAHYEGLVPLESGTNQIVLIAASVAGTMTSKSFTAIRSTRFQAAITNPVFGVFATVPSNTVGGYVSALFDAGLPTQTNITSVTINGVPAILGTNIDGNGNVPFWTTNYILLRTPITGTIAGPGIPTSPTSTQPPAEAQVYEVTHKVQIDDDIMAPVNQVGSVHPAKNLTEYNNFWNLEQAGACWRVDVTHRVLTTETQDLNQATSQVQSNHATRTDQLPDCLTTFDPDQIAWQLGGSSPSSHTVSVPISRGLYFGIRNYEHGAGTYHATERLDFNSCIYSEITEKYRTLRRELDTGKLQFRAPREYGTNTTVIFTFEGVDYRRASGKPLDLSQIKFHGQNPIAYSNAAQTVSYLLTVDGGKEYEINEDDFQWPPDQQLYDDTESRQFPQTPDNCYPILNWSFAGDWSEDMHWLSWANFHNLFVWITGSNEVLYLCAQQQQTNLLLTAHASTENGTPYTAGTYTWSVTAGSDRVQMDIAGQTNIMKITPKAASQQAEDVEVSVTFKLFNVQYTATKKLTVRTPGGIINISTTPYEDQGLVGGGLRNFAVYQVIDQLNPPRALAVKSLTVTEQFSEPYPGGCNFGGGNNTTDRGGHFTDTLVVPALCQGTTWEPTQTLGVDCVTRCHQLHYLPDKIVIDMFEPCP